MTDVQFRFFFIWGYTYAIKGYAMPRQEVKYLGLMDGETGISDKAMIVRAESELQFGYGSPIKAIPNVMYPENVYIIPAFYFPKRHDEEYMHHVYKYRNFEMVNEMIKTGAIKESHMCAKIAYLWDLDLDSAEIKLFRWFVEKTLNVDDFKMSYKIVDVNIRIMESMMQKELIEQRVIEIFKRYAMTKFEALLHMSKERISIRASGLPF